MQSARQSAPGPQGGRLCSRGNVKQAAVKNWQCEVDGLKESSGKHTVESRARVSSQITLPNTQYNQVLQLKLGAPLSLLLFGVCFSYRTGWRIIPFLVTNIINYVILENTISIR